MTDMRATERLLEVIEEASRCDYVTMEPGQAGAMIDIAEAIAELRRRGDTLVRRDDLREAMEMAKPEGEEVGLVWLACPWWVRLENAIGGKL